MMTNEATTWFLISLCSGLLLIVSIAILSPWFVSRNRKTLRELLADKGNQVILVFVVIGVCVLSIVAMMLLAPVMAIDY